MHTIEELRILFIDYLKQESFETEPQNLYAPNNYFLQIGGKRLRPILLLLAAELFEGDIDTALPAALSIEYFHNFTLIHDDVMDQAPTRRGFQTIHEKYNLNTAILSGDVLLVKAYEILGRLPSAKFQEIFKIYTKTAIEVCEGQQYDIDFERKELVSHAEYIEMIRLKTSVLLAASMQIGALLGNASDEEAKLIYTYAENLGIAFQIQDDILDCYGDETLVGKQPGGDIIQNKKTLLMIEALKHNDERLTHLMIETTIQPSEKINGVLAIYDEFKIKEFATKQRDYYVNNSLSVLDKIKLTASKRDILKSLVEHLVVRNF